MHTWPPGPGHAYGHTSMARTVCCVRPHNFRATGHTHGNGTEPGAEAEPFYLINARCLHKISRHSDLICSTLRRPGRSFHFVTFLCRSCALHKSIQFVINFKTFHFILILMPANACRRRRRRSPPILSPEPRRKKSI